MDTLPGVGDRALTASSPAKWKVRRARALNFQQITLSYLAAQFRKRGILVVLGGPHVTLLPDEAQTYADVDVAAGIYAGVAA